MPALTPLVLRVNGVQPYRDLSQQVVTYGFVGEQERTTRLPIFGAVIIMTAAFRVGPHGLKRVGAAIDEQIGVGPDQRGRWHQS
jgi:hypothetical protein